MFGRNCVNCRKFRKASLMLPVCRYSSASLAALFAHSALSSLKACLQSLSSWWYSSCLPSKRAFRLCSIMQRVVDEIQSLRALTVWPRLDSADVRTLVLRLFHCSSTVAEGFLVLCGVSASWCTYIDATSGSDTNLRSSIIPPLFVWQWFLQKCMSRSAVTGWWSERHSRAV